MKNNKIIGINEVFSIKLDNRSGNYDGYKISTEKGDILILISSYQQCCEDWGYFESEDNLSKYIGSDFISLSIIDETNSKKLLTNFENGDDLNQIMFVEIKTSIGDFQFAVYNFHNGYYGHDVLIKMFDKIIEDTGL